MSPQTYLPELLQNGLWQTLLPDFILAFAFFTALVYAVLARRFGQQRPAVAMAAAVGFALSMGLVWWEQANGRSIKNLGPLAAGFAIIVLAGVMYQAIRQVGGNWAGAGIAVGASLLVGRLLGPNWRIDREIIQTVIVVALTAGVIAFLLHRHGGAVRFPKRWAEVEEVRHDMTDLHQDRRVARRLSKGLRQARREADHLHEHPEQAQDIMLQLRRMLPAEGWLTERMARLRERAHLMKQGDLARIEEIQEHLSKLPPPDRQKAAKELTARYHEQQIDQRLERLDRAAAENERRIRDLTRQAEACLEADNYKALSDVLAAASRLQRHNARLFRIIDRTEARLMHAAKQTTGRAPIRSARVKHA